MPLARHEPDVQRMVPHMLLHDRDRTVDPLLGPVLLREDRPHHHMQTPQRLLDQGDAQLPMSRKCR